jgi:hypothetical protein
MAFQFRRFEPDDNLATARAMANRYTEPYSETNDSRVTELRRQYDTINAQKPADWTGGKYGEQMDAAMQNILNRKPFVYDMNADELYQQYKDRYIRQGQQAMADTMGQAAMLTGGYGNSYAQTVGQQQYNNYMQALNDRVPELYQLALQRYQAEGDRLNTNYGLLSDAYGRERGEYEYNNAQWQAALDRAYNMYADQRNFAASDYYANRDYAENRYANEYARQYNEFSDANNWDFAAYQQAVAEDQFAQQMAARGSSGGSGGSGGSAENYGLSKTAFSKRLVSETKFNKGATAVTRGNRGNTGNGGVKFNGRTYNSYADYLYTTIMEAFEDGTISKTTAESLIAENNLTDFIVNNKIMR